MKTCVICGLTKPIESFSTSFKSKDVRMNTCRKCNGENGIGRAKNPKKGFGSNPQLASEAAKKAWTPERRAARAAKQSQLMKELYRSHRRAAR